MLGLILEDGYAIVILSCLLMGLVSLLTWIVRENRKFAEVVAKMQSRQGEHERRIERMESIEDARMYGGRRGRNDP